MTLPALQHRLRDETGFMMLELVMAMSFLAVAVGALVSVYASSIVSLQRTSTEGTALTLVNRQIELYNTLPYASIQLDASTIPASTDPYVTAHSADTTIPASTGQVTGATVTANSCTSPTIPQPSCAAQVFTGPDGRQYRVDTYIIYVTPPTAGSRALKQVTAVGRLVQGGVAGAIRARVQSAYDQCNPPAATAGATC